MKREFNINDKEAILDGRLQVETRDGFKATIYDWDFHPEAGRSGVLFKCSLKDGSDICCCAHPYGGRSLTSSRGSSYDLFVVTDKMGVAKALVDEVMSAVALEVDAIRKKGFFDGWEGGVAQKIISSEKVKDLLEQLEA